jgi:RimJ/RimL family protein N-acetyltransferase
MSDATGLGQILRDRRATRYLPLRVRKETGKQFVTRALREQRRGGGPAFAIVPIDSKEAIGQIRFINWSLTNRESEMGYWIRRKFWGRGFGSEAVWLASRFGFRSMSLRRIEAIVVVGNTGSRRVLEKAGFRLEGRSREASRLSGRWVDEWRFGLLRGELAGLPSP